MTHQTHTIAESNNFIVLDKYIKTEQTSDSYQSESDLERELIQDLRNQGYEFIPVKSQSAMLANVREQLQNLNGVVFNDSEWRRFTEQYLDNPSDGILDKTRKIHIDYICDFIFDDERLENIYLIDKKNLMRNKVQIIQQFEQAGSHANRYDVTILVNGLPLVQIELKKRGVAIRDCQESPPLFRRLCDLPAGRFRQFRNGLPFLSHRNLLSNNNTRNLLSANSECCLLIFL